MFNDPAFLGTGWSFPPSFTKGGAEVVLVSGTEDIHQSLRILLSTRLGERVMREDYGCDLFEIQFEEIDQSLVNRVTGLVTDAILLGEPRIQLDQVAVDESATTEGLLLIQIAYTVRTTNSRYNMVYPFHLYEATSAA
jgi:uncharacterized protein